MARESSQWTRQAADQLSFRSEIRDLVDGSGQLHQLAIPPGANRAEVLWLVTGGGAAGTLEVRRHSDRERTATSAHIRATAATLVFVAGGVRTVIEIPPDGGFLFPVVTGLVGTGAATVHFWRQS